MRQWCLQICVRVGPALTSICTALAGWLSKRWFASVLGVLVGLFAGFVFWLVQKGFHEELQTAESAHLIDSVTPWAPIFTFGIAVAACAEQLWLHRSLCVARMIGFCILNVLTFCLVLLVCMSLVRLDLSRSHRPTPSSGAISQKSTPPASGAINIESTHPLDTKAEVGGISELPSRLLEALNYVVPLKKRSGESQANHYEPILHIAIVFLLFSWFVLWDWSTHFLSPDPVTKKETKALSLGLNIPTLCSLLILLHYAPQISRLAVLEKESFVAGIIAFHLAFAACAFLFGVILRWGGAIPPQPVARPCIWHSGQ